MWARPIQDLGIAFGDCLMQRQHVWIHVSLRFGFQLEMPIAVLAAHQASAVVAEKLAQVENALFDWAYMPILPPELTAAICTLRHLRSGCTLLHHNGFDDDGAEGARRTHIFSWISSGSSVAPLGARSRRFFRMAATEV
jgi:hypothetical protein